MTNAAIIEQEFPMQIKPALCLDLDGTIRYSKSGKRFIQNDEDVALFDDVQPKLKEYKDKGFIICGVSNQGGVAHGIKTVEDVGFEAAATLRQFDMPMFDFMVYCFFDARGNTPPFNIRSLGRKPDYGMLVICEFEVQKQGYLVDWDKSLFVGDRPEDQQCAQNARIEFQWAWDFFGRPNPNTKE